MKQARNQPTSSRLWEGGMEMGEWFHMTAAVVARMLTGAWALVSFFVFLFSIFFVFLFFASSPLTCFPSFFSCFFFEFLIGSTHVTKKFFGQKFSNLNLKIFQYKKNLNPKLKVFKSGLKVSNFKLKVFKSALKVSNLS